MGNNYPRVVEAVAAGIPCEVAFDIPFVGFGFGGRGAHGSLDLVEESKTSHKHPRPNRRHSAVRGANRANCEICRSANLRPTYRNSLGRMDLSMGFLFHEISRSYRALSSIGPQNDAHAAARALGIQDYYCKWHDVFLRGSAALAPLFHDRPFQAQPRPAPPRPAPSLLSANAGPLVYPNQSSDARRGATSSLRLRCLW